MRNDVEDISLYPKDPEYVEKTAAVQSILEAARKTYGSKNQILVCMEELNELACVLAKYPRYYDENKATEELYARALDEVADVTIILEHVKSIFGIHNSALNARILAKVDRLNRWLRESNSMQQTIDDRKVVESASKCHTCCHGFDEDDYEEYCAACLRAQATEGAAIYYKDVRG